MSDLRRRRTVLVQVNHLELGGSQINAVDLAAGVRELGYDAVLVGPADSRPDGPSLFEVAADRGVRLNPFDRPTTTLEGARTLSRLAASCHADLVHVYGTWSFRPAYWGPCALARRPLVLTVYEMEVDQVVFQAPPLIVGTGYLVEDLQRRHGPVHLISPPVDLERDDARAVSTSHFLKAHGLNVNHLRIVIVSRLDGEPLRPAKTTAIEAAIHTLDRLRLPDVDLIVVGTGKDEARLRRLATAVNARLGRPACVLTGPMYDPRPAYAAADIVLGMGGSAARGLAFSKPLVVTGEFGWFATFSPESARGIFRTSFWSEERKSDPVAELIRELEPLLVDPDARHRLGQFGRSFAEANFGLTAMARRLADIYDQTLTQYGFGDWLYDLALESKWAAGWLGRRVMPSSDISTRAQTWSDRYRADSPRPLTHGHRPEATVKHDAC